MIELILNDCRVLFDQDKGKGSVVFQGKLLKKIKQRQFNSFLEDLSLDETCFFLSNKLNLANIGLSYRAVSGKIYKLIG